MSQNTMHISLVAVSSLDGFILKGEDHNFHTWTSDEDKKLFFSKIEKAKLIFMGRKTYEHAKAFMKHRKGRTRVVFTRFPKNYMTDAIPGILEFTLDHPKKIVDQFFKQGIRRAILVGGSEINTLFLKSNLVSEMHITIEPVIFGSGKKMFDGTSIFENKKLKLISVKKLNKNGTLYAQYKIS